MKIIIILRNDLIFGLPGWVGVKLWNNLIFIVTEGDENTPVQFLLCDTTNLVGYELFHTFDTHFHRIKDERGAPPSPHCHHHHNSYENG